MRIKHAAQKLSARTAFFVTKAARVLVFMILDYCVCRAKEVQYFRTKVLSYESTFRKYSTFVLYESILFSKVLSYGSTRTVHVLCVSVYLIIKRLCSNPSGQNI